MSSQVTSKGQVTIPQVLRERYGFRPGTEIEFVPDGNTLRVVKTPQGGRGQEIVERLRGKATIAMTTDEILALTRSDD